MLADVIAMRGVLENYLFHGPTLLARLLRVRHDVVPVRHLVGLGCNVAYPSAVDELLIQDRPPPVVLRGLVSHGDPQVKERYGEIYK